MRGTRAKEKEVTCTHAHTDPWRAGKYETDGNHGPAVTRTIDGATLYRSWTLCLDCGMRIERGTLAR